MMKMTYECVLCKEKFDRKEDLIQVNSYNICQECFKKCWKKSKEKRRGENGSRG